MPSASSMTVLGCCFLLATGGSAFTASAPQLARVSGRGAPASSSSTGALHMAYVPDGLSAEQWREIRQREQAATQGKNLGAVGVTKFKSRSQRAWQEAGAEHLFPVDPRAVPVEDRPYMMRGGSWDNSDLKSAGKRVSWIKADVEYANGGERQAQSVSVFGGGAPFASERLDWTGRGY
ncbi:unnamed protein product [Phaeothamnion confervicola]